MSPSMLYSVQDNLSGVRNSFDLDDRNVTKMLATAQEQAEAAEFEAILCH